MFSPVESQVIFLSKETPDVSVGLRTAEVPYMDKKKNGVKIGGRTNAGTITSHLCTDFPMINTFIHSNYVKISYLSPIYMPFKSVF